MKLWTLALMAFSCVGCTMASLERHTVAQAGSVIDLRYQEVLDNLAMIAKDPASLPAYSTIFSGTAQVTDTEQLSTTTVWQYVKAATGAQSGFSSEALNPQLSRAISQNWTLDPIVVPEKMEALRSVCRWALYGRQFASAENPGLLESPDDAPGPGRHFGVARRLERMPAGWLHVGSLKDVPAGACYQAHCGDTWVWVLADGTAGLAEFTLVFQDIARVDSNSPSLFNLPSAPSAIRFYGVNPGATPKKDEETLAVTVILDYNGNLAPAVPYYRARIDNFGADSRLRSAINAAGSPR